MLFFNTNFLPRKIYFLLFFIPLLTISDHLHAKQVKLLILGDSLSAAYGLKQEQGWVSLLQDAWHDKPISIVNATNLLTCMSLLAETMAYKDTQSVK